MKLFLLIFVLFLVGFIGLSAGLLLKRKGLRGGCGSSEAIDHDCKCRSSAKPIMKVTVNPSCGDCKD